MLGHRRIMDFPVAIGYGTEGPDFWISTFEGIGPNREIHLAFQAKDAATVRAWYAEAMAAGAESLHEPRLWPEYHAAYFGAFVRDTEGNNIEAVLPHRRLAWRRACTVRSVNAGSLEHGPGRRRPTGIRKRPSTGSRCATPAPSRRARQRGGR